MTQTTKQHQNQPPLFIDGQPLTIEDVISVARGYRQVVFGDISYKNIKKAHSFLQKSLSDGQTIYGVNTGFGSLARTRIDDDGIRLVQLNLIRSHAAGIGEPLSEDIVRSMMLLLAASLSRGHSGVRPAIVEQLIAFLNNRITPCVPSRGSVGASGDLAPLAHIGLVLVGEGDALVHVDDNTVTKITGCDALEFASLKPVCLEAKEGLAIINGTHLMASQAALSLYDLDYLVSVALGNAAMMIDACRATDTYLDGRLHDARNQAGQKYVASRLRSLTSGSEIIPYHLDDDPRVQDPYSIRCTPQVLGAVVDTIEHARVIISRELGAVTDNPQVFAPSEDNRAHDSAGSIISGGNFHGMPLAIIMDSLAIAVSHLAGIAERRMYYLLAASDSENPVNTYLSPQPGLHSGLMIVQYAAAACCNEIQTCATPASIANIPTSAGQEDYNSFGPNAGFQLRQAIELATNVLAMELLCATEALEYQRPLLSSPDVEHIHKIVRTVVSKLEEDRPPSVSIESITQLIHSRKL